MEDLSYRILTLAEARKHIKKAAGVSPSFFHLITPGIFAKILVAPRNSNRALETIWVQIHQMPGEKGKYFGGITQQPIKRSLHHGLTPYTPIRFEKKHLLDLAFAAQ